MIKTKSILIILILILAGCSMPDRRVRIKDTEAYNQQYEQSFIILMKSIYSDPGRDAEFTMDRIILAEQKNKDRNKK